ncbi:MAG TPA: ABC transporter permease [Caldilinea sp.]|nr:ABC transporter permease [Anaerolineales bacterium]HRA66032.1 ABC transporter permease [Caldilinea sp.]
MVQSKVDENVRQREHTDSVGNALWSVFRRSDTSVVLATLILFVLFSFSNSSFLTPFNLFNVSRTAALYVFVALGQAMVIVIGGMNLSLGAIGGLTVVVAGWCMDTMGWSPWIGVPVAMLAGTLCGMFNGFIIIKSRLNSFIVTLASLFIFTGLVQGISQGFPYSNIPKEFTMLGRDDLFGVPYLFFFAVIVLIVLGYVFKFRVVGRRILATGGNLEAARLSGIRTDNIVFLSHTLSGVFAATAGLLWVSRMGSAQPSTGTDWLIISFAVAIIGGTALNGGEFSALGILASAIMLTLIKNGLIMLNVNVYFEQTFLGVIVLLAVSVESIRMSLDSRTRRTQTDTP